MFKSDFSPVRCCCAFEQSWKYNSCWKFSFSNFPSPLFTRNPSNWNRRRRKVAQRRVPSAIWAPGKSRKTSNWPEKRRIIFRTFFLKISSAKYGQPLDISTADKCLPMYMRLTTPVSRRQSYQRFKARSIQTPQKSAFFKVSVASIARKKYTKIQ